LRGAVPHGDGDPGHVHRGCPLMSRLAMVARATAALVLVLVLIQAVMAGRFLSGDWAIGTHGVVGNVVWAGQLVLVGLVVIGGLGRMAVLVAAVLAALLTVQLGLGYTGRTSAEAVAWHVPL